jgi:hypothetical protein
MLSFCSARWASPEVSCSRNGPCAFANLIYLGIEEALVGTMVEQQSFITDFGLDEMSDDERAEMVGNVVSMS